METLDVTENLRDDAFKWEDGRLVLYEYLPTLMEMSSFTVAFDIWDRVPYAPPYSAIYVHIPSSSAFSDSIIEGHVKKSKKFVANMKVPAPVAKMIANDLDVIGKAIRGSRDDIFNDFSTENFIRIVCVESKKWLSWRWRWEVEINVEKTIMNIVSDTELNETEKFKLMCKFCLADEIEKISLSSLPNDFVENVNFDGNPLEFYWICYLRNELHKIPLNDSSSIDGLMAGKIRKNIIAFEYFLDRLDADGQFIELLRWFRKKNNHLAFQYLDKFLSKLTQIHQDRFFCRCLGSIVEYFWIHLRMPKCTFSIWMRVRDRCNVGQFSLLIKYIINNLVHSETDMSVLIDIWNTAPDHLKNDLYERNINGLLHAIFGRYNKIPALNTYKFFHLVYSVKNDNCRGIMLSIAIEMASHYRNSPEMIDVLKLCWPYEDEQSQFNQDVFSNSTYVWHHVLHMIERQMFAVVSEMLTNYALQENFIRNFMEKLLIQSNFNRLTFMSCHASWLKLSEFIDKIYGEESSSLNIKKQFVSSFVAQFSDLWLGIECLNELPKIVEPMLSPEELQNLKKSLLDSYEVLKFSANFWYCFEEKYLRGFLEWCLGDDAKIDEFRKTFPIDNIFNKYLKSLCEGGFYSYDLNQTFNSLDKCLLWCLGSVDEAKKYRIRKMHELDPVLRSKICRDFEGKFWKKCAERLFDNDENEINVFKMKQMNDEKSQR